MKKRVVLQDCDADCFNCPYEDCLVDRILPSDSKEICERDLRWRDESGPNKNLIRAHHYSKKKNGR